LRYNWHTKTHPYLMYKFWWAWLIFFIDFVSCTLLNSFINSRSVVGLFSTNNHDIYK
jgi:hypothetical protein